MAYKYEGFWRAMDTLRDRQVLEDMVERGEMPWRPCHGPTVVRCTGVACMMRRCRLQLARRRPLVGPLSRRAFRRYRDWGWRDAAEHDRARCPSRSSLVRAERQRGARERGQGFSGRFSIKGSERKDRGNGLSGRFFPGAGRGIKSWFETLKARANPDLILTHYRDDAHQDHRQVCRLTWNTFRDHCILEYEIPKWDGDMGQPNLYVPVSAEALRAQD